MQVKVYSKNPSPKEVGRVRDVLMRDGVMIYPTDSLYAYGCSIKSPKAVERLKGLSGKDNNTLTLICRDISQIAEYCKIDNAQFKILKRNLPGAFTFILKASSRLPDKVLGKRSTIGVRIPDSEIVMAILEAIDVPLLSSSLKSIDDVEYTTDAELIHERWGSLVDIVVDGGEGYLSPSTVVDMSEGDIEILREGEAELIL